MDTRPVNGNPPSPLLAQCLNVLRERATKLQEQGILHAGIFGSVARGDDDRESDVDVLIDISAFDVDFGITKMVRLQRELSAAFGRPVDLVSRDALKSPKHNRIIAEAVEAF